jgi:hypothetical protein
LLVCAEIMGVIKSKGSLYWVRRKVPAKLGKRYRQYSERRGHSRGLISHCVPRTAREPEIRAKPVLMECDPVLAKAEEDPQRKHWDGCLRAAAPV